MEVAEIEQELCEIIADLAVNEDPMAVYLERYPVSWFTLALQFSDGKRICFKTSFYYNNDNGVPVVDEIRVEVKRGNRWTYMEDIGEYARYFGDGTMARLTRMVNYIIAHGSAQNRRGKQ